MSKLISVNENGVIWVESDNGDIFGIVSATEIIDADGIKYQDLPLEVLECNGFELEQDYENEATFIELFNEDGDQSNVVFSCGEVKVN